MIYLEIHRGIPGNPRCFKKIQTQYFVDEEEDKAVRLQREIERHLWMNGEAALVCLRRVPEVKKNDNKNERT